MKVLVGLIGAFALLGGLWFTGDAILTIVAPSGILAMSLTVLYTAATAKGVIGVALFILATLCNTMYSSIHKR